MANNAMKARQLRRQKMQCLKDGGGNPVHRRTKYATVSCQIHGRDDSKGQHTKQVNVAIPRTKREQTLGCPFCNAERNNIKHV